MSLKRFALLTILITAACLAGCNREGADNSSAELANLPPSETLTRYFTALEAGQIDTLPMYFAADVDRDALTKYLKKTINTTKLSRYVVPPKANARGKKTTVKDVKFRYQKKKIDKYGTEHLYDGITVTTDVLMVKENGVWKIRKLDPALNHAVEKAIFMRCKKTVHEARLAMAKYHNDNNNTYPVRIGELNKYLIGFKPDACSVLKIDDISRAGKIDTDYRMTAVTRNMPECTIRGTDEKVFPETYDRCPRK